MFSSGFVRCDRPISSYIRIGETVLSSYKQRYASDGNEYVRVTLDFDSRVLSAMVRMPDVWKDYIVTPIVTDSKRIAADVVRANACYVRVDSKSDMNDVLRAYDERIKCLEDALRTFKQFDFDFERLMSQVDLLTHEKHRLTNTMLNVLQKQEKANAKEGNDTKVPVDVILHYRIDTLEYRAINGRSSMRLGLDAHKCDVILACEAKSRDLVAKRLTNDRQQRHAYASRLSG